LLTVLYPLSYRRMERRTGFEPATSRVANEVTAIFTTDHVQGLAGNRRFCWSPPGSTLFNEVTDIFTTAMPKLAHAAFELARWGTGDIGFQ
jgi:hypothetical protein